MNSNKTNTDINIEMNSYNRGSEQIHTATATFNRRKNYQSPQDNRFSNLENNRELDNSKRLSSHDKTGPRYSEQGPGLSPNQNSISNQGIENLNSIGTGKNRFSNGINSENRNLSPSKGLNSSNNLNKNKNNSNSLGNFSNQNVKNKVANKLLDKNPKTRMVKNLLSKKQNFGSKNAGSSFFRNTSLASSMARGSSLLDNKDKLDDMSQSQGLTNIKVSKKAIVTVAAILAPTFAVVVFLVLIVAATQTYLTANKLGQADSVSDDQSLENINKVFGNEEN